MRRERIIVVLLLLPSIVWLVAVGGWVYNLIITLILSLAALEYGRLFIPSGLRPSLPLLAGGTAALALARGLSLDICTFLLSTLIMITLIWHLVDFERGAETSGTDFAITVSGILYVGWIGSYLISLRAMPDGLWWLLLALPSTWMADSAAYLVGSRWGKRHLAPRLSPNKTWEGYLAGVVAGTVLGGVFAVLWRIGAGSDSLLSWNSGMLMGFLLSVFCTLGDLGISMFKRQLHVKDTGHLLPGHGGALDRIDTWIWAAALGQAVVWLLVR
ncbi:MAG: CDP-archaeol synthase [Anaerolineales bacterium]|nr:CDP-archaeol synthase [Anaerolineales bacterium]